MPVKFWGYNLSVDLKCGIYQHYKGKKYLVIGKAKHSDTLEELVVYTTLYENPESTIWVRPEESFLGEVEIDGNFLPRFKYLGDTPQSSS